MDALWSVRRSRPLPKTSTSDDWKPHSFEVRHGKAPLLVQARMWWLSQRKSGWISTFDLSPLTIDQTWERLPSAFVPRPIELIFLHHNLRLLCLGLIQRAALSLRGSG